MKGIENGRAEFAYRKALEGKNGEKGSQSKEYRSYCDKVPMMIKTNGLGNTLAFMKSKGNKTYLLLYNQIEEWFKREDNKHFITLEEELVYEVIQLESGPYRMVTGEVLALFNWLRRFAKGLIEEEENG